MKKRSNELEIMDLGREHYTLEEYNDCLYQLGRIGKYLGNTKKMLEIFYKYQPNSILDVGCGGGSFTIEIAQKFRNAQVVGIDINRQAIEYAINEQKKSLLQNISFEFRNEAELNETEKSFDILTANLVLHHLKDDEIIKFLCIAQKTAKKAIIINDLHRHWLPYIGSSFIMPLFFRNRLVCNDSLLSIKKSFNYTDLKYYLDQAKIDQKNYHISWNWPFRWIVEIKV